MGVAYGVLPFRVLVDLYRMLTIFILCAMINAWDIVSAYISLPGLSTEFLFEKGIELDTTDRLYIKFT